MDAGAAGALTARDGRLDDERDDEPFDRPAETRPIAWPERREPAGPGLAVAVVVAVVALLAGGYWFWRERRPPPPLAGETPAAAPLEAPPAPAAVAPARPALDGSDAWVRGLAATLSAHPELARWLATDDLVRRLVAATIQIADGSSPSQALDFLRPADGFRASRSVGRWFVDAASFRRYDLATEVLLSIDGAAAARLHAELHPLLDQAYGEIGDPASSFDATLARAVANLRAVPVPDGEPELVQQGSLWAYADRALEQRTAAEKHLLRMGPDNARRVQAKLGELASALGLPPP